MVARWRITLAALVALAPTGSLGAPGGDLAAVLTEIRVGQGEVRVKLVGEADWTAPLPLLSLRAGDQIRVTRNATAILMFTSGQGTQTVSAANSPFTVQSSAAGPSGRTGTLVADLGRFLMGKKKALSYVPLATRSIKQPPLLLSPRDGRLLGPPIFDWGGSDRLRYAVRLFSPQGRVWEQAGLPRASLPYPASAPPLTPGLPYRWELEAPGFPPQQGRFVLLGPVEIASLQEQLALLDAPDLPGYPQNTRILLRAALLFDQGLYAEARKELLAAISADPDEPCLHLMLGQVYERTALTDLAAEEFDEAEFLSSGMP